MQRLIIALLALGAALQGCAEGGGSEPAPPPEGERMTLEQAEQARPKTRGGGEGRG